MSGWRTGETVANRHPLTSVMRLIIPLPLATEERKGPGDAPMQHLKEEGDTPDDVDKT